MFTLRGPLHLRKTLLVIIYKNVYIFFKKLLASTATYTERLLPSRGGFFARRRYTTMPRIYCGFNSLYKLKINGEVFSVVTVSVRNDF